MKYDGAFGAPSASQLVATAAVEFCDVCERRRGDGMWRELLFDQVRATFAAAGPVAEAALLDAFEVKPFISELTWFGSVIGYGEICMSLAPRLCHRR